MLKVLGRRTSINVRKVLWTVDELGLPYEREDWGMPLRDPHAPEFLALNPNAQVPAIIDDGFVLWESSAIMRYICEREGGAALLGGADLRQRALVSQWLSWQATELNPAWGYAVYALLRKEPGFDDEARINQSLAKWTAKMQILEDQLAKADGFVAGAFSLADVALGLSVRRWMAVPRDRPELPAVRRYYEELQARPAAAEWMSEQYF